MLLRQEQRQVLVVSCRATSSNGFDEEPPSRTACFARMSIPAFLLKLLMLQKSNYLKVVVVEKD